MTDLQATTTTTTKQPEQPPTTTTQPLLLRETNPVLYAFKYLNSPETQRQYPQRLKHFFDRAGLPGRDIEEQGRAFLDKARGENKQWAEEKIILFLDSQKQRVLKKELAAGTLRNLFLAIKTFYDAYDDLLPTPNWKRISKALPRAKSSPNDRSPFKEEIQKLCEHADLRIKSIVYTMCSSGIRVGGWDFLRWKHVTSLTNEKGEVVAAKLLVYAGEPEEYYTFITPEAYNAPKEYMDFRASHGESITGESWVIRNRWQTVDVVKGGRFGLATHPKKLPSNAIKKILVRALSIQGIRVALPKGARRYEWKGAHGYRKFFQTRAAQVMSSINVEYLMGHSLGLTQSYYKPTEQDVLIDYLKAVDLLTINDDNTKQKILELDSRTRQQQEIEQMKAALETTQDQVGMLLQMLTSINQEETKTTGSKKDFLLRKLGVLTNGEIGEDPNNPGIVIEPAVQDSSSSSKPCVIYKMIEKEEQ